MDPESVRRRRIASAPAGKPALPPIKRTYALPDIAGAGAECEGWARDVLLAQPGVATVEEVRVKKRWGRMRGLTACISIRDGGDARDICRCAAQALTIQLRVADICLMIAAPRAATALQEGTL